MCVCVVSFCGSVCVCVTSGFVHKLVARVDGKRHCVSVMWHRIVFASITHGVWCVCVAMQLCGSWCASAMFVIHEHAWVYEVNHVVLSVCFML